MEIGMLILSPSPGGLFILGSFTAWYTDSSSRTAAGQWSFIARMTLTRLGVLVDPLRTDADAEIVDV